MPLKKPAHERVMDKVEFDLSTECWVFMGSRSKAGYGRISVGSKPVLAHRLMWEHWEGEKIPKGEFIDHLCRNPPCVNPDHLEPVTPAVNAWRGRSPSTLVRKANRCTKGHSLVDNVYESPTGWRRCRICKREYARTYYLTNRHKWQHRRRER